MNRTDILALLDYHAWAHDRLLTALEALTAEAFTRQTISSFASLRDTVAHMLLADEIWLARWQGVSPPGFPPYDTIPDVTTARDRWRVFDTQARTLIESLGDEGLQRTFSYRLRSGATGRSTYAASIQHVVNHGTYHSGQVTTLLRQAGHAPPASLDMVTFDRERLPDGRR